MEKSNQLKAQLKAVKSIKSTVALFNYYQMLDSMNQKQREMLDRLQNPEFTNLNEKRTEKLFESLVDKFRESTDILIMMDKELNKRMFSELKIKFDYEDFIDNVSEMEDFTVAVYKKMKNDEIKKAKAGKGQIINLGEKPKIES